MNFTWYSIQLGLKSTLEIVSVTSGIKLTLQWNVHHERISRVNVFPIEQEVGFQSILDCWRVYCLYNFVSRVFG